MSKSSKIYTKTGDKGKTSLIGGTRVDKYHERIEAYGTVDELNSYLGLIRDICSDKEIISALIKIQKCLFKLETTLATDSKKIQKQILPSIEEKDIEYLEMEIDKMDDSLPVLKNFVLPGGNIISSHCHIARTICRRTERITIKLDVNNPIDSKCIKYLNRLSDYLFVLSRKILYDKGGNEIIWNTK